MAEGPTGSRVQSAGPDPATIGGEAAIDRPLLDLMSSTELGGEEFGSGLAELEARHGSLVYARLLTLLCHLEFEPQAAKSRWQELLAHRRQLEERWGWPVDLRVALASFFIQVDRRLENPTIIEMRLLEQTQAFAYRDELTGLRNYRFFEFYLFHEFQRSEQYGWPLSLILLDVDDFKAFNDRHGHVAGNEALATAARLISATCRKVDITARYGGEEFAVIAPATPKIGAMRVAERAREAIAAHKWTREPMTVSAGVATFPGDAGDGDELMRHADEALYLAKARGKDQVRLYGDNRRSYRRIPLALDGQLRAPAAEPRSITTIDVSEAGVRFLCDSEVPLEALVELRLDLPDFDRRIKVGGRVVQSTRSDAGYDVAVRSVDLSSRDRRLLSDFLNRVEV